MKKYQLLFSIIFILTFLISFYLGSLSLKKTRPIYLQDLNVTTISFSSILPVDDNQTINATHKLWGMTISLALRDRELQRQALERLKRQDIPPVKEETTQYEQVNVVHRTICIEKKCWLFVGKMEIGNVKTVTLLSKENLPKLETYGIGDYLSKKTKVVDIKGNEIVVINEDTMEYFKLTLFDINISQYKPK